MADDKDGGKSGGPWFPGLNNLLLILLAGTLFVTQAPFHDSRPAKSTAAEPSAPTVDARLWQDPFEAVDEHIKQHEKTDEKDHLHEVGNLKKAIRAKIEAGGLTELNLVVAMIPGYPYFEDGETRRRLRYAVLSGFDAASRYLPEDPDHLDFFLPNRDSPDGPDPNRKDEKVAYEWLIYKPVDGSNTPPREWQGEFETAYKFPPILVFWVANEDYRIAPHHKLKSLIETVVPESGDPEASPVEWNIHVLGPYDSNNLQDLVNEFSTACTDSGRIRFRYFSPSATVEDPALLKNPRRFVEDCAGHPAGNPPPGAASDGERKTAAWTPTLSEYFRSRGLPFLRITTTDRDLASAMKKELELRGIKAGSNSRIVLVSEWDTLYGWHLPTLFADVLMEGRGECRGQGWDAIVDPHEQCIFRFSYLRGLDGDKLDRKAKSDNGSRGKSRSGIDSATDLEDADGDSQFDYVRRLAGKISRLSGQIADATDNPTRHPIQAVGILGSDVYDKLLILEAMNSVFPDAIFFTNGLDARFLHPEQNEWARNLVMVSRFGQELDPHLQRDVPPFRDSTQTAFFLATEMALAHIAGQYATEKFPWLPCRKKRKNGDCEDDDYRTLLATDSQEEVSGWLREPRLHEVGRTRLFGLRPLEQQGPDAPSCGKEKTCPIHPAISVPSGSGAAGVLSGALVLLLLLCLAGICESRRFLGSPAGLWFVALVAGFCFLGPLYISALPAHPGLDPFRLSAGPLNGSRRTGFMVALGLSYVLLMIAIAMRDDRSSDAETGFRDPRAGYRLGASLTLIVATLWWVWRSTMPLAGPSAGMSLLGRLDSGEPYALFEGVSMWPSEAIRLLALITAGYFILDVCRFPRRLTAWMETQMQAGRKLLVPGGKPPLANSGFLNERRLRRFEVLREWMAWRSLRHRLLRAMGYATVFYCFGTVLFFTWGFPHTPFRGGALELLDSILTRGFLVPTFVFLLFLVVDAVWKTVHLVGTVFGEDPGEREAWPLEIRAVAAQRFAIDRNELHEWISMRFIDRLTDEIYRIIGYPLVIALLLVLARSSYFDDWVMPVAFKVVILFSLALLFFSDYRLKKAADEARRRALQTLNYRVVRYQGENLGTKAEQTKRLIHMIEESDDVVYRAFTQRPIFRTSLLIVAALLADAMDFSTLGSKLF